MTTEENTGPETGAPAADWRAGLPEDLRTHPALENFDGVDALAREHVNAQKLIGRKGVIPPGPDGNEGDWARYYSELGRPATPEDYDLSGVERPDDLPWNEADEAHMLARMHAVGLTNDQARALVRDYAELQGKSWREARARDARTVETALGELKNDWGGSFDARIDLANRAFAAAFGENVETARQMRLADGSLLGDHPTIVRAFAAMGETMREADLVGGKSARIAPGAEEARGRLSALETNADTRAALLDRGHPDHRRVVAERSELAQIAFGGGDEGG